MILYDPNVIHQHAQRLYDRALGIVVIYAVGLGLLGLLGGAVVGSTIFGEFQVITALLGGAALGLIGVAIGRERSFELRLQAQTALCQVQIELNSRVNVAQTQVGWTAPPS
jgi:hypothetical protein